MRAVERIEVLVKKVAGEARVQQALRELGTFQQAGRGARDAGFGLFRVFGHRELPAAAEKPHRQYQQTDQRRNLDLHGLLLLLHGRKCRIRIIASFR